MQMTTTDELQRHKAPGVALETDIWSHRSHLCPGFRALDHSNICARDCFRRRRGVAEAATVGFKKLHEKNKASIELCVERGSNIPSSGVG